MTIEELIGSADELQSRISAGNIRLAYQALEAELVKASREVDLSTYLPGGPSSELGMAASEGDGAKFFAVFKRRLRDKLCDDKGELSMLWKIAAAATAGQIVTALLRVVPLPLEIAGVLFPIAAIIATTGIEAYCEKTA